MRSVRKVSQFLFTNGSIASKNVSEITKEDRKDASTIT